MTSAELTYSVATWAQWAVFGLWFGALLVALSAAWRRK